MVRLHATRLMAAGEVALWNEGSIIWQGVVGSQIGAVHFDTISFSAFDCSRMQDLIGDGRITCETVRRAIAEWWNEPAQ